MESDADLHHGQKALVEASATGCEASLGHAVHQTSEKHDNTIRNPWKDQLGQDLHTLVAALSYKLLLRELLR